MGRNGETEVAQNLRAEPVAQSDIFEPNQVQLRSVKGATGNPRKPAASARGPGCCRETKRKKFCFVYGFRFVNGRLVAFWGPASEVNCPEAYSSRHRPGNEAHRQNPDFRYRLSI